MRWMVSSSSDRAPDGAQNCLGTLPVTLASRRPRPAASTMDQSGDMPAGACEITARAPARQRRQSIDDACGHPELFGLRRDIFGNSSTGGVRHVPAGLLWLPLGPADCAKG